MSPDLPKELPPDLTVFIVDDDDAVRDSLQILLESAELTVEAFASPTEFLDSPAPRRTGCLLVDVRMPDMDGITVQERLKSAGSPLPVIVMTGHADVPLAVRAMKAGAVDFVEKPFDDEAIIETVRRALEIARDQARQSHAAPGPSPEIVQRLALLTPREREVLDGLRLRPGHQPAHRGDPSRPRNGEDAGAQFVAACPDGPGSRDFPAFRLNKRIPVRGIPYFASSPSGLLSESIRSIPHYTAPDRVETGGGRRDFGI